MFICSSFLQVQRNLCGNIMVSIIVPIYLVKQYLPKCIESIINQTYRDIEIILVDDGSPDNCGKICDVYARKDKRIKVFQKRNGGISDARNFGIIKASGEYIGFVDGDDWIEPNMYEELLKVAIANKADIVNCGVFLEYPEYRVDAKVVDKRFDNKRDLIRTLVNGSVADGFGSKLFRKSCFTNIQLPEGHVYEDYATMYKFF